MNTDCPECGNDHSDKVSCFEAGKSAQKATPLYRNPSAYHDKKAGEMVANLFARDRAGECVVQVRGDYAREWAKAALVALPDLLALAEAATQAADRGRHQGDSTVSVPLECMDKLRAALSRLTAPQKDAPNEN